MKIDFSYNSLYRFGTNPAIIAVAIFFLLLMASSSEYMVNDEGMWNYIAFLWIEHGIPPYTGAIENKTPGIYVIFTISNLLFDLNIWFPRILGSLSLVATSVILHLIGRRLYDHLAGILAMIIFGLSVTWRFTDGTYTAQTESFMILFSTVSFFLLLRAREAKSPYSYFGVIFLSGISMGIAITFKQVAVFSTLALFIFLLALGNRYSSPYKNIKRDSLLLLAGIISPICLFLIPLLADGAPIINYFNQAWIALFQHGGGANKQIAIRIWRFIHVWRYSEMLLFYPLLLIFIFHRKQMIERKMPFWGIVLWIILDFLGVNASGFYFGHQFKQLMPSIALASGIAISISFRSMSIGEAERHRYIVQIIVIIAVLWMPYRTLYRFYSMHSSNGTIEDEYGQYKQLGLWIKEHTKESDYVYILGKHTNPAQAYSKRRSASRYFNSIFIGRKHAKREIIDDLLQKKPKFILIEQEVSGFVEKSIPELEAILKRDYKCKSPKYNVDIYIRSNISSERVGKHQSTFTDQYP